MPGARRARRARPSDCRRRCIRSATTWYAPSAATAAPSRIAVSQTRSHADRSGRSRYATSSAANTVTRNSAGDAGAHQHQDDGVRERQRRPLAPDAGRGARRRPRPRRAPTSAVDEPPGSTSSATAAAIAPRTTTMREAVGSSSSSGRLLGAGLDVAAGGRRDRPSRYPTSGASAWCTTSSWPRPCTSRRCSIAMMSASTTRGWNCLPEFFRSSSNAVSCGSAFRYERVDVIASNASATATMCGSIGWPRSSATGANSAASLVALGATGARKSMRVRISTETSSCMRTCANSSAVSLPFLFSRWFGHDELADVVHQRGEAEPLQAGRRHARAPGRCTPRSRRLAPRDRRCTGPWPRARR